VSFLVLGALVVFVVFEMEVSIMSNEIGRREFMNSVIGAGLVAATGVRAAQTAQGKQPKASDVMPTPTSGFMPSIAGLPAVTVDDRRARSRRDAPVAVVKSSDARVAGYELMRLLKPALRADRVFLKVNMSFIKTRAWPGQMPERPQMYATGSDPRFVEGLMQYLREQGIPYNKMTIGEGAGWFDTTAERFEAFGFGELAKKTGARLLDINNASERMGVKIPGSTLMPHVAVSKPVVEHYRDGVLINIAKLKTHQLAVTTLGIKNMMGVVLPAGEKPRFHAEFHRVERTANPPTFPRSAYCDSWIYFATRLVDLYSITPDLIVIDGIIGGEGSGFLVPDSKETMPVESHRAFGSTSGINVDAVASSFMGYDPRNPQVEGLPELDRLWWIYLGAKRGHGHEDVSKIQVLGDRALIKPDRRFRLHKSFNLV
jgi:uncharacterized protein (DUF362 family)